MNKLIIIGVLNNYICYLNLSKEEAIEKYFSDFSSDNLNLKNFIINTVKEITFENSFNSLGIF